MKRASTWLVFCLLAFTCRAASVGELADVRIIDRDSGASLPITHYRGEYWIAGRPGARYAISIANRSSGRLLAVTSVDGIDVLSGATADWNQGGYVFAPSQDYQISGWRKSDQQVAAFVFAAASNSYADLTGRPANLGVIGVALFCEQMPKGVELTPEARLRLSESDAAAPTPQSGRLSAGRAYAAPDKKLGTGHGEREDSYVTRAEFNRRQPRPDEVIRIRYDSTENLVAMGILRVPRMLPTEPNPFPGSSGTSYVPDPPG